MEDVTVCVATIRVAKTNVLNTLCNRPSETLTSGLIIHKPTTDILSSQVTVPGKQIVSTRLIFASPVTYNCDKLNSLHFVIVIFV